MEKENKKDVNFTLFGMTLIEDTQRYGEAISQIIQAYKGIRLNEFGDEIIHKGRNLKDISNYKLNSKYRDINIKQQAGFSAELIEEARQNKEAILKNSKIRVRTSDGIGNMNDVKYDHIKIDKNGNIIKDSGSQMKFLKVNQDRITAEKRYNVVDKLANNKSWDRYDTTITIPKEDYEGALKYAQNKFQENINLSKKALENGKLKVANKHNKIAEDYKRTADRLKAAKLSQEEAINARINPKKFVRKEIIKDVHQAGKNAFNKNISIIGTLSAAQNLYEVINGKKDIETAIKDTASDTIISGATSYVIGGTSASLKAFMHSSNKVIIRKLGTTSAPSLIATGILEVGRSIRNYAMGEITEYELLEEIGEKGVGMITAGYCASSGAIVGATIGSIVPGVGTVIGGAVGSIVGAILGQNISSVIYRSSMAALKAEKISYERRIILENIAREAIQENEKYTKIFIENSQKFLQNKEEKLSKEVLRMNKSFMSDDNNKLISSINNIGKILGYDLEFNTMKEIDEFMLDETKILKL